MIISNYEGQRLIGSNWADVSGQISDLQANNSGTHDADNVHDDRGISVEGVECLADGYTFNGEEY